MKKNLLSVTFLLTVFAVFAQTQSRLTWNVQIKKISDSLFSITATTAIPEGWNLYAPDANTEGLQETVIFAPDYENARSDGAAVLRGTALQVKDLVFNKQLTVYKGSFEVTQSVRITGPLPEELKGTITAFIGRNNEFISDESSFSVKIEGGVKTSASAKRIKVDAIQLNNPLTDCGTKTHSDSSSLLSIFFLGFIGGLIALVTPCVFPMIPVTVSFFTRRSANRQQAVRNGIFYGFFIFLIYTIASLPFHLLGNIQPEIFNNISTNVWLNISFFAIFIIFAFSFFGFFEITLPSSFAGKADSKGNVSSLGGIFFMALTLAIVSFSCTGPILGSLLVGSLSGGAWQLTSGLAGFGLALALPFALFAIFPHWLQSLPKSGGWLDTVKKFLAFIELALALKFLSNADLVMHWGLIKREVFIGIWILIGFGLTLYLFGILRLPHDYKGMKISNARKVVGLLVLAFTLYLVPGVTSSQYANLQLLSGFPPPLSYSIYGYDNVKNKGLEANVLNDYEKALQLSREEHKPLMIDFTGWACVNCRKMEENVWTQPKVHDYIKNNFILVSLYVDDRGVLPVNERFTYSTKTGDQKDIHTIGDKWATFQAENFSQVTQPLYALLNNNEALLNHPVGYTPDADAYLAWLQCAKNAFDNSNK
ncbi:MAG TPA: cytochrome c biogenesis protein CcdA [Panacibacter sp.]|nr:cytochrome c biogenesis protein CcdA [Panacibacter sp.]HNP45173.1 cytochrome c biogenesis protein CcdA [Panacibacter sp.]